MDAEDKDGERIAKRLARAGLCSRRDAERWILEGRVAVNGKILTSPALVVTDGDDIVVDGKPVPKAEAARLWRYHKPSGLVTTARDEKGRRTVFEALPPGMPRVISVGRLDLTSEGLLLLTNDGELARHLELPATGWTRRYRARAFGNVDEAMLAKLARGIEIDGVRYGPIEAALERQQGHNAWITVGLKEGKNREVRKVLEHLGLQVNRLIRIAYGPFQLGKLDEGKVEEVPKRVVQEQLGAFLGDAPKPKLAPAPPRKSTTAPTYARPRHAPAPSEERAPSRSGAKRQPARARDDERQRDGAKRAVPARGRSDDRGAARSGPGDRPARSNERGPAPSRSGPKQAQARGNDRGPAPSRGGSKPGPSRSGGGSRGPAPRGGNGGGGSRGRKNAR